MIIRLVHLYVHKYFTLKYRKVNIIVGHQLVYGAILGGR